MGGRRRSRELALQMLYQWDLNKDPIESVHATFWGLNPEVDLDVREYTEYLSNGAIQHMEAIDVLLASHAEHWRVARMATVDRNILRLATFELLYEKETPPPVVINEALEIARRFSTPESIHFINGILDSIRKKREE
jgi:transcription antitermination protein NusB